MEETRICSCCRIEKLYTNEFYNLTGNHKTKCRKCKNITIGDKPITEFMNNITDNWKFHPDYTNLYFERDTNKIFNRSSGKYIVNIRSITNMIQKNVKQFKWEIFNGAVPQNKIIKTKKEYDIGSIILDQLECIFIHCENCNTLIESPDNLSRYCSKRCQLDVKNNKACDLRNNNINRYLIEKHSIQKNINKDKFHIKIDYDVDYLISLGTNCFYCDVKCSFGNKEHTSCGLSIDRKDSNIGYCKDNIVVSCWFCNMMKNITVYDDWIQFIDFVKKPEILELDLSNKCYSINSREIDITSVYGSLKKFSPNYYPDSSSAKKVFLDLCKEQNYKDSIFYFFPIIFLERNCLWNASMDAIDSTLPNEEKHRPDNLQIIPKIMNYGKHIHTQEQFLKEWNLRGFKTDFSNCTVKLPENYSIESYFNKMITK